MTNLYVGIFHLLYMAFFAKVKENIIKKSPVGTFFNIFLHIQWGKRTFVANKPTATSITMCCIKTIL